MYNGELSHILRRDESPLGTRGVAHHMEEEQRNGPGRSDRGS